MKRKQRLLGMLPYNAVSQQEGEGPDINHHPMRDMEQNIY